MEFFKYTAKTRDISSMIDIYEMIWKNKLVEKNARSWYKGYVYYEDAMGDVFDGVMARFDPQQGFLENFTIKTLHTINKNKKKREYNTSEAIEKKMLNAQSGETNLYMELPTTFRGSYEMIQERKEDSLLWTQTDDILEAMPQMAEHFVRNFGAMYLKESKDNKFVPAELIDDYSLDTLVDAQAALLGKYGEMVYNFLTFGKEDRLHSADSEKYKSKVDTSVSCEGKCQGMWILKRKMGSHKKILYQIELDRLIDYIWRVCYSNTDKPGMIEVENKPFYMSLSGKLCTEKDELLENVENEVVNTILSKSTFRVFAYDRGKELVLSTTKETEKPIVFKVFTKPLQIDLEPIAVKEIE